MMNPRKSVVNLSLTNFKSIRIAQFGCGLAFLCLSIVRLHRYHGDVREYFGQGDAAYGITTGAHGVGMFSSLLNILLSIYFLIVVLLFPRMYSFRAVLTIDILLQVLWFAVNFLLVADSEMNALFYGICYDRGIDYCDGGWMSAPSGIMYSLLAFSIAAWMLSTLCLIVHIVHLYRNPAQIVAPSDNEDHVQIYARTPASEHPTELHTPASISVKPAEVSAYRVPAELEQPWHRAKV